MLNQSHVSDQSRDPSLKDVATNSSIKGNKKKKSLIPNIFKKKGRNEGESNVEIFKDLNKHYISRSFFLDSSPFVRKSFSDRPSYSRIKSMNLCTNESVPHQQPMEKKQYKIFVGTWNVGGKPPHLGLKLEDFLQVEDDIDIYVLGFQEIVPLNAGNVLVIEDNEPATKWLSLINQFLNNRSKSIPLSIDKYNFDRSSLKYMTKNYRVNGALAKTCNCPMESSSLQWRELIKGVQLLDADENSSLELSIDQKQLRSDDFCLISNKQMVGIFLSVWVRNDIVGHIGHLRVSSLGRGIMGYLGNKGSIAVSMTIHRTSFCFICSHLASGEKEGDELRRNADVNEILKNTVFSKICKRPLQSIPEKIMDHDMAIWLGDLNYRVSLSYEDTINLLEDNEWNALLEKDQLNMEKEAGRVFNGWKEGHISFAPTYKYSSNSDEYAGETTKSKNKRRTPAWCDRILWHGDDLEQLQYSRVESRFSDHRPVYGVFKAQVDVRSEVTYRDCSDIGERVSMDETKSQRHNSSYEL